MNRKLIVAVGAFLQEYENDLALCRAMRQAVEGQTRPEDYLPEWEKFINYWKVGRNVPQRHRLAVLSECISTARHSPTDVDGLSLRLKAITGQRLRSLASKCLMLYSPHVLPPYDSYAARSLGVRTSTYAGYLSAWKAAYREARGDVLLPAMQIIKPMAEAAEGRFPRTPDPEAVRLNRLFDKYLWTAGAERSAVHLNRF